VWIPVQWKGSNPLITITYGRLRQQLLGLAAKGLTTVVACAAGYRAEADKMLDWQKSDSSSQKSWKLCRNNEKLDRITKSAILKNK
jgi:hypothetical protein